jgi:hypothetical protein
MMNFNCKIEILKYGIIKYLIIYLIIKYMNQDSATLVYITRANDIQVYIVLQCESVEKFQDWEWCIMYFQNGFPHDAVFDNSSDAYMFAYQLEENKYTRHGIVTNDIFMNRDFPVDCNGEL